MFLQGVEGQLLPGEASSREMIAFLCQAVLDGGNQSQLLQNAHRNDKPGRNGAVPAKPVLLAKAYTADRVPMREQLYYRGLGGIDSLKVKYTGSGEIVRGGKNE
jgi:hypothetical protein